MDNWLLAALIGLGFALTGVLLAYALSATGQQMVDNYQDKVLDSTRAQLSDLFIFMDSGRLLKMSVGATIILPLLVLIFTGNPLLVIGVAVICLFGPRLAHSRLKQKRHKKLVRQLPDSLDALVGALRSGMSLTQSLGLLADQLPTPSCQEFALVVRKLRMGVGLDEVLNELEVRANSQEYTMFTTSMRIAREVGGNLTESLERLAETMRKKLAMEDKIEALTSQGKLQGIIVGCLPLFLMWALTEMEPEAMHPLFNTWMGYGVLLVIFLLEFFGFVLIRKIVRIDV